MSSFTDGVVLQFDKGSKYARLYHSFYYHIGSENSAEWIFLDKGFRTDGNSRPWFLGFLFEQYGPYTKAAVVHDKAYACPWVYVHAQGECFRLTRKTADGIFREALLVLGCPAWKAKLAYYMLRAFGWVAWRKHRKTDIGGIKL